MLTSSEIQSFENDGIAVLPAVFDQDELSWFGQEARALGSRLTGRVDRSATRSADDDGPAGTLFDVHTHEDVFRLLATHPRILRAVRGLAGEALSIYRSRLILDRVATRGDGVWRNDFEAWHRLGGLDAPTAVTALIGLGSIARGTAAIHVLPGSHLGRSSAALAVDLPLGSVALLDCRTAYALGQPGRPFVRPLFLVSYDRARQGALPVAESQDDCLWLAPFAIAG